jgi:tRNA (mo5U34)-methyltransferase
MFKKKKKSGSPDPSRCIRDWDADLAQKGWWHSFELPDGSIIQGVNDLAGQKSRIAQFPIAADLTGKRVLDIGAWDGWFSFEMERRGAEVMAVDNWDNDRFRYIHQALGSRVDYRILDVYDLHPDKIGRFDIVLFLGVLYHLKHPLLALEKVCALTTELAAVDSYFAARLKSGALMEFYELDELGGQFDNWVGPSVECLLAFCRTAGFARVELRNVIRHSACVACYRKWEPAAPASGSPPPDLVRALHNTNFGINFCAARDEYVSCWFRSPENALRREDVQPEVAGFGSQPTSLRLQPDGLWQVNFKLPPGLARGWHEVRLRTRHSPWSSAQRIAVDLEAVSNSLAITGVCDGASWTPGEVALGHESMLTLWVAGLPENADRYNVRVHLGQTRLALEYVSPPSGDAPRQLNAKIPPGAQVGEYTVTVAMGDTVSAPIGVKLT